MYIEYAKEWSIGYSLPIIRFARVHESVRILVIGDRLGVTGNQKEKKKIFHINGTDYDYEYHDEL